MPDEKIEQKRPTHAQDEPKPIQQQHVDDTVEDSFPASDPPAWTTSASKSVAAECEPDALNEPPTPPGQGLESGVGEAVRSRAEQASGLARDLYARGRTYLEEGRRQMPQAARYYRQGAQAVSRPVQEHPLAVVIGAGVAGFALGWLLGRRTRGSAPVQWHPGSNRRPREAQNWRPAPRAVRGRRSFPASNEAEAASHTNNSF